MLRVICPKDGTVHQADEAHTGKMLRCAKCGGPVQIGSSPESVTITKSVDDDGIDRSGRNSQARNRHSLFNVPRGSGRHHNATLLVTGLVICFVLFLVFRLNLRERAGDGTLLKSPAAKRAAGDRTSLVSSDRTERPADPSPTTENGSGARPWRDYGSAGSELNRTLTTGTRIRPDSNADGNGVLTIDNMGGEDSEVKVISTSDGRVVRDVFVQKQTKTTLKHLRPDSYVVMFAVGEDWKPSAKHFTRSQSFFEFGKSLAFNETQLKDGVEYSRHDITLYTLPQGNVPREPIAADLFDSK